MPRKKRVKLEPYEDQRINYLVSAVKRETADWLKAKSAELKYPSVGRLLDRIVEQVKSDEQ